MRRYEVRILAEASDALRRAFLYVQEKSGPERAADWLAAVFASIDHLETEPHASQREGNFAGREIRSYLVMSHRVFFTIDGSAQIIFVIDVIHTARQTKLEKYREDYLASDE